MPENEANNGSEPFNAASALKEAMEGNWLGGRKLTFREKCGAFAALYAGQQNKVVAKAFGISVQTTSKLAGCLESDPDPYIYEYAKDQNRNTEQPLKILMDHNRNRSPNRVRHYKEVALEFEALGKDEFNARYYTPRVHNRIILAKHELAREK